jgi:hypothetical protein
MGRYISTTGTSSSVIVEKSTTYTAKVNERVVANTTGGAWTLTLPVSTGLLVNDVVQIIDPTGSYSTNNLTVARNGAKIQNLNEDLTMNINNVAITFIYTGTTYGWLMSGT